MHAQAVCPALCSCPKTLYAISVSLLPWSPAGRFLTRPLPSQARQAAAVRPAARGPPRHAYRGVCLHIRDPGEEGGDRRARLRRPGQPLGAELVGANTSRASGDTPVFAQDQSMGFEKEREK